MTSFSMTTLLETTRPARRGLFDTLARLLGAAGRDRDEHRTIIELSRHDPQRLLDMGFDPAAIYDAVEGTWDQVPDARRNRK